MPQPAYETLAHWANFYVIAGSSAGALTGLQFVVMTLIAEPGAGGSMREIRAFGTPTTVQFGAALLLSALMCAPWQTLSQVAVCLTCFGVAGLLYAIRVIIHARTQTGYKPDAADWLWYTISPLVTYGELSASAFLMWRPDALLITVAALTLAFLFLGIRNSWDTVTYIAVTRRERKSAENDPDQANG